MPATRVDFYLLKEEDLQAKLLYACRLLEKAYGKSRQVFVYCNDQTEAEQLDELLWTFKEESFIPHNLQGEGPEPPPPIQIGCGETPRGFHDILMNLADEIPAFYTKFSRVIELVSNDETAKETARTHYKAYRAARCSLQTHEVEGVSA